MKSNRGSPRPKLLGDVATRAPIDGGLPSQLGSRPLAEPGIQGTPAAATLAAIAWIVVAVAAGTLAFAQWSYDRARWSYVPRTASDFGIQVAALVNVGFAIVGLTLGALLLTRPTRLLLRVSIPIGLLAVMAGAAQAALGYSMPWLWVGGTVVALLAIAFSWAAGLTPRKRSR